MQSHRAEGPLDLLSFFDFEETRTVPPFATSANAGNTLSNLVFTKAGEGT